MMSKHELTKEEEEEMYDEAYVEASSLYWTYGILRLITPWKWKTYTRERQKAKIQQQRLNAMKLSHK